MKNGDCGRFDWLTQDGVDKRKCLKHKQWRRKGVCEMCEVEKDLKRKAVEKEKLRDV